jgi:hypothetical protein
MDEAKVDEFWRRGFCVLRDVIASAELDPIRAVIARSVEARAAQLLADGHISHGR